MALYDIDDNELNSQKIPMSHPHGWAMGRLLQYRYYCRYVLRWMPWDLTYDNSTLVQVMAWCRQATSHCLSQCRPSSMSPYGITRPQCPRNTMFMEKVVSHCHSLRSSNWCCPNVKCCFDGGKFTPKPFLVLRDDCCKYRMNYHEISDTWSFY